MTKCIKEKVAFPSCQSRRVEAQFADAILDRLLHNAHHLVLTGESMRKNEVKHKKIDLS